MNYNIGFLVSQFLDGIDLLHFKLVCKDILSQTSGRKVVNPILYYNYREQLSLKLKNHKLEIKNDFYHLSLADLKMIKKFCNVKSLIVSYSYKSNDSIVISEILSRTFPKLESLELSDIEDITFIKIYDKGGETDDDVPLEMLNYNILPYLDFFQLNSNNDVYITIKKKMKRVFIKTNKNIHFTLINVNVKHLELYAGKIAYKKHIGFDTIEKMYYGKCIN